MRSEIKNSVIVQAIFCTLVLGIVCLFVFFTRQTLFVKVVGFFAVGIFGLGLANRLTLIWRLSKGCIFFERKTIVTATGGNFHLPLPKKRMNVWLSLSGPIGRLKGNIECVTDQNQCFDRFRVEDYRRTSRSGIGSITRNFGLNNASGQSLASFLNITLDLKPRIDDDLNLGEIKVLVAFQET